jgi:hypothetical protein
MMCRIPQRCSWKVFLLLVCYAVYVVKQEQHRVRNIQEEKGFK